MLFENGCIPHRPSMYSSILSSTLGSKGILGCGPTSVSNLLTSPLLILSKRDCAFPLMVDRSEEVPSVDVPNANSSYERDMVLADE